MKANTSLLVLGLFTIAGAVTVSCGGSSDDDNDSAGGTSSTSAGTSSTSAGTTSKAGTAGTNGSSGGTSNGAGGTGNGGRNNNGGTFNTGGFFMGLGGAGFDVPSCPDGTKSGGECTPDAEEVACQLNDTTFCGCRAGDEPTWLCIDPNDFGQGGQGPGLFEADCPDDAETGDACTGLGLCTGQQCVCGQDSKVTCF